MESFKMAIFDLDGTLIDSRQDIFISINATLSYMNFPIYQFEEVLPHIGWGIKHLVQKCLPITRQHEESILNKTLQYFENHHLEQCTKTVKCYDGVIDFLYDQSNLIKVLLTNKKEIYTHKILKHLKLDKYFSKVIGGDTLATTKPNPAALETILKDFSTPKKNIIMIGDGIPDILFAHNSEISSLAILEGGISKAKSLLEAKPTYHCDHFSQIKAFLKN